MSHRTPRPWTVSVRRAWPRPAEAFTQGLCLAHGRLWESTGIYGRSSLHELCPGTGVPRWSGALPGAMFGEGVCPAPAGMWQLTWREGVAVQWDLRDRRIRGETHYDREGWGACGSPLGVITSDGGDELVVRDPLSLRERRVITVTSMGRPVFGLNDLDWAAGRIWANVHGLDCYLGIDPDDGSVTDLVDARVLRSMLASDSDQVLNGLAHTGCAGSFYVTGKCWTRLFEVVLVVSDLDPPDAFDLPTAPTLRR